MAFPTQDSLQSRGPLSGRHTGPETAAFRPYQPSPYALLHTTLTSVTGYPFGPLLTSAALQQKHRLQTEAHLLLIPDRVGIFADY